MTFPSLFRLPLCIKPSFMRGRAVEAYSGELNIILPVPVSIPNT